MNDESTASDKQVTEDEIAEKQRDLTKERQDRCEPLVKKILELFLDKDLLLSDREFLEQSVKLQFDGLVKHVVYVHFQEVFEMVNESLKYAVDAAVKELWGKEKEGVTVADVDKVLKNADRKRKLL